MSQPTEPIALRRVVAAWWPLAASWLLMGIELPLASAVMARMADPRINLAAYGGIVFPVALFVEAPVIMLLATSTALCRDWPSFVLLRRFSHGLGAGFSAVHGLIAFTPLYDHLVVALLQPPPEIVEPARLGLQMMLPWTWAIAARRFQQGVLIRYGHSRAVGLGTVIRLVSGATVLAIGSVFALAPGVVVAATAAATGVTAEALFVAIRVRPLVRDTLPHRPPVVPALTLPSLAAFHAPLALTSFLHLMALPIGSAAMGRLPETLVSLAVWPVLNGLVFFFKSVALAFTEVVVVMLDEPGAVATLRRFAHILAGATSLALVAVAITPLGRLWFVQVSALGPELAVLAGTAVAWTILMPALTAVQSWHQGVLVNGKRTRAVSEAVIIALVTNGAVLLIGIARGEWNGIHVALAAALAAAAAQNLWLQWRSRPLRQELMKS